MQELRNLQQWVVQFMNLIFILLWNHNYFVHFGNCSFYKSAKKILFRKSTNQNFTRMTKNQSVKWQFRYLTKLFNHRFYACRIFFYSICISFLVYGEGRGKKIFSRKIMSFLRYFRTHNFFSSKGMLFFLRSLSFDWSLNYNLINDWPYQPLIAFETTYL